MATKRLVLLGLVVLWAALFAASYVMSTRIEGPKTIDTGFKRLNVLFGYQATAFTVAILAAVLGFVWRRSGRRMLLTGAIPLLVSGAIVAVLLVAVTLYRGKAAPDDVGPPTAAAPAVPAVPDRD